MTLVITLKLESRAARASSSAIPATAAPMLAAIPGDDGVAPAVPTPAPGSAGEQAHRERRWRNRDVGSDEPLSLEIYDGSGFVVVVAGDRQGAVEHTGGGGSERHGERLERADRQVEGRRRHVEGGWSDLHVGHVQHVRAVVPERHGIQARRNDEQTTERQRI